jgi:hypothetical protein
VPTAMQQMTSTCNFRDPTNMDLASPVCGPGWTLRRWIRGSPPGCPILNSRRTGLFAKGKFGLENLNNLGRLPAKGATVSAYPLLIEKCTWCPLSCNCYSEWTQLRFDIHNPLYGAFLAQCKPMVLRAQTTADHDHRSVLRPTIGRWFVDQIGPCGDHPE